MVENRNSENCSLVFEEDIVKLIIDCFDPDRGDKKAIIPSHPKDITVFKVSFGEVVIYISTKEIAAIENLINQFIRHQITAQS